MTRACSRRLLKFGAALLCLAVGLLLVGIVIRVLNPLPSLDGRSVSRALTDTRETRLGRAIAPRVAAHPGLSGVHLLTEGRSAFAARVHLARSAERSLDLQYYIWHDDLSGSLLFDEVRRAADRGVRVRLLLDDNTTVGMDPVLAALDAPPAIEVRLFNPFVVRSPRILGYLTDFRRLNRRMHNKSFTADNQVTVIGGRNVGDEYFGAGEGMLFADLDLLGVGPVVAEVSRSFDEYWASASAYPANLILAEPTTDQHELSTASSRPEAVGYLRAVAHSDFAQALLTRQLAFEWAPTRMAADDPAKGLGRAAPEALLWPRLRDLLGEPERQLGLVSGYFVPTAAGVDAFARLARQGVQVTILTNALEATDVPIVHAGYAKWRKPLLRTGVTIYEMRAAAGGDEVGRNITMFGSTGSGVGGAASALHAKTFSVDGERIFVGSFNFDPRSVNLNTELGFVVESASLARRIKESLEDYLPQITYKVEIGADGDLIWLERAGDRIVTHDTEPGTGWGQRAAVSVLSRLPIEWLL